MMRQEKKGRAFLRQNKYIGGLIIMLFLSGSFLISCAQKTNVIPCPAKMVVKPGKFILTSQGSCSGNDPALNHLVDYMIAQTASVANVKLASGHNPEAKKERPVIRLELTPEDDIQREAYTIDISPEKALVKAGTAAGVFYGIQSLLQLLSVEKQVFIPCMKIKDEPRFAWRGLMLDVSRHFFTTDEIKRLIDQMAAYKFNTLHLHLTDDQGWRLEIKSLPALTEVGAWRVPRTGLWWERNPPAPGEAATYGGFYTQEEMKELIRYAASRYIRILPEIDVPGHSLAAIASYPQLSCTKKIYQVNPGSKFYGEDDNALCPGQEATFEFMDKVLTEITGLFPFEYVHIGGDECFKGFWEKCDSCKRRMANNHLDNTDELQSYFIKRLEKMLKEKGRKLIGWDEILEGGLAPDATVMSWRGMQGGIEAAKAGHHVIMSPMNHAYLDLYQGDPAVEPPTYEMLRLKDVYSFDPVPDGVNPSLILGGQGNLWTESVPTFRHAEYMFWPRSLAMAEVLWSPGKELQWDNFIQRTEQHLPRLERFDINYARSFYDAIVQSTLDPKGHLSIRLETEIEGLELYYTFDNTYPDDHSKRYRDNELLAVPKDADTFRVITYRSGQPVGKMITVSLQELENRTKVKWIN